MTNYTAKLRGRIYKNTALCYKSKGLSTLNHGQKAEGGKKMGDELHDPCYSCGKDLAQETEFFCLNCHRVKLEDIHGEPYIVAGRSLTACSPQCMILIFDSLKEEYQKEIDKNKTNAVGPTMKGSPGCAHGS